MKYSIRDREAGNTIATFETYEDAIAELECYEAEDKENGDYTPDFYEIVEHFKTNEIYTAVTDGNFIAIRYDGSAWEETDEYDEEIQNYVNFKPCYFTEKEIEKIVKEN